MSKLTRNIIYLCTVITIILIDQITKFWALKLYKALELTSFLYIELSKNSGISWGILAGKGISVFWLLTALIVAIIIILFWQIMTLVRQNKYPIGELLVFSGALSNLIDRFVHGAVIDFIVFHKWRYEFPAFNFADVCITIGVFLMIIDILKSNE